MNLLNRINEWFVKTAFLFSLGCGLLVTGCHNNEVANSERLNETAANPVLVTPPSQTGMTQNAAYSASTPTEDKDMAQGTATVCQHELAALAKINPAKYASQKALFDNLLKSASVYSSVREDVNPETKDIMDTLYKYKTQRLCGDIQKAVHESLIARGESLK
ncbi:hypothetical protein [Atlantibacter hermannii]|uniref:hypothetical protein n=1 Tax=Atlantibacter hermannii TaxID=565 RepID=UPI003319EB8B